MRADYMNGIKGLIKNWKKGEGREKRGRSSGEERGWEENRRKEE